MSTSDHRQRPYVGVGVFIRHPIHPSKILLGHRLSSIGAGTWGLPGGHLERGESFESCARRETLEETVLPILPIRFLTATNGIMPWADAHYVTIFMVAEIYLKGRGVVDVTKGGWEPILTEPDKCGGWVWVDWDEMVRAAKIQGQKGLQENSIATPVADISGTIREMRLFSPLADLLYQRPGISLDDAV